MLSITEAREKWKNFANLSHCAMVAIQKFTPLVEYQINMASPKKVPGGNTAGYQGMEGSNTTLCVTAIIEESYSFF